MDELEVFVAVVEGQGFSAAAKRLDSTPASVTRRIKALEERLGEVLAEAAMQGLGITLLPDFIFEAALADGRLMRVFEGRERSSLVLSVLYPSRRHLTFKTGLFIDYVIEQLTQSGISNAGPSDRFLAYCRLRSRDRRQSVYPANRV